MTRYCSLRFTHFSGLMAPFWKDISEDIMPVDPAHSGWNDKDRPSVPPAHSGWNDKDRPSVPQPGYSEHHTGLALDLYFKMRNEDGSFTDVYYNEDMEKEEYKGVWDAIHAKLADYGFILRSLAGKEHITGYRYEPWHIRYLDNTDIAREIMSQPGLTLEEYIAGRTAPEAAIDLSETGIYTDAELYDAMLAIKCKFAAWGGCEMLSVRYAGDEANNEENLTWLNSLDENAGYTQAAKFLMDFRTTKDAAGQWDPEREYTDYAWWLARTADGGWEIVTSGY